MENDKDSTPPIHPNEENRILCEALFPRPELKDSSPLILYFANAQERREFVALVHETKPHMKSYEV